MSWSTQSVAICFLMRSSYISYLKWTKRFHKGADFGMRLWSRAGFGEFYTVMFENFSRWSNKKKIILNNHRFSARDNKIQKFDNKVGSYLDRASPKAFAKILSGIFRCNCIVLQRCTSGGHFLKITLGFVQSSRLQSRHGSVACCGRCSCTGSPSLGRIAYVVSHRSLPAVAD